MGNNRFYPNFPNGADSARDLNAEFASGMESAGPIEKFDRKNIRGNIIRIFQKIISKNIY